MTAPVITRPPASNGNAISNVSTAAPKAPDHRTTALQSAVSVLRGRSPAAKTEEVLDMAEAFYRFLTS